MKKVIIIIVLLLELFLLFNSKIVIIEFRNTLNICLYSLMPTMFFSILFSNILFFNNFENILPNLKNKNNISIIILSMLSGYPNNIKLLKDDNNEYMNYCTNYVNPLFLIGTVGTLYLKNMSITIIIFLSHYISNIIMYLFLKNKIKIITSNSSILQKVFYTKSVTTTITTLAVIIGNLLLISLFISLLKYTLPFNQNINSIIFGLIEFSKGIYEVSICNLNIYLKGLIILIIITFGSISIHLQSITINPKIKYIRFLLYRLLNVLISIFIYFIILSIYKFK